jgi:hypothetical protein
MTEELLVLSPPDLRTDETEALEDLSPRQVLARLQDPTLREAARGRLIIEAEALAFDMHERRELEKLLWDFILEHRDSDDTDELLAVGSAIRKYVAVMAPEDLSAVAVLLDPCHPAPVPLTAELELTKMVVHKLSTHPPQDDDSEPELAERLMELARLYVNPRQLPREKYSAVAIHAVLALLLLRSSHVTELVHLLRGLPVAWFTELVGTRSRRLRGQFQQRFSEQQCRTYLRCVDEVAAEFVVRRA